MRDKKNQEIYRLCLYVVVKKSSTGRFGNASDWFHRLIEFWKRPIFAMCRSQGNAATPLSNKNEIQLMSDLLLHRFERNLIRVIDRATRLRAIVSKDENRFLELCPFPMQDACRPFFRSTFPSRGKGEERRFVWIN